MSFDQVRGMGGSSIKNAINTTYNYFSSRRYKDLFACHCSRHEWALATALSTSNLPSPHSARIKAAEINKNRQKANGQASRSWSWRWRWRWSQEPEAWSQRKWGAKQTEQRQMVVYPVFWTRQDTRPAACIRISDCVCHINSPVAGTFHISSTAQAATTIENPVIIVSSLCLQLTPAWPFLATARRRKITTFRPGFVTSCACCWSFIDLN